MDDRSSGSSMITFTAQHTTLLQDAVYRIRWPHILASKVGSVDKNRIDVD